MLSMGAKMPKMPVFPELSYLLCWFSREDPETESDMQPNDSCGKGDGRCQSGWGGVGSQQIVLGTAHPGEESGAGQKRWGFGPQPCSEIALGPPKKGTCAIRLES